MTMHVTVSESTKRKNQMRLTVLTILTLANVRRNGNQTTNLNEKHFHRGERKLSVRQISKIQHDKDIETSNVKYSSTDACTQKWYPNHKIEKPNDLRKDRKTIRK